MPRRGSQASLDSSRKRMSVQALQSRQELGGAKEKLIGHFDQHMLRQRLKICIPLQMLYEKVIFDGLDLEEAEFARAGNSVPFLDFENYVVEMLGI